MTTIEELESFKPSDHKKKIYSNTTKYFDCDVSPINHPAALANYILNVVEHTKMAGCNFIGAMGWGKSTSATVISHHIHLKRPEFNVVWGEAEDFMNINEFLNSLPKCQPVIINFDDITGAWKQMSDKDMEANFNTLTKIRWIIDPKGETPVIVFTTSHYSRSLEKQLRAVLGITAVCSFGNEERTNSDLLAPKGTLARFCLERFARIAVKMFSDHEFYLKTPYQTKIRYETDKPLRPFCALVGTEGYIITYSKEDCCNVCSKPKTKSRFVEPEKIYEIIKKAYGKVGVQALKLALWKRGHYAALGKDLAPANNFIEKKVFPNLSTDFAELVNVIYRQAKKKPPTRLYHKRKLEDETLVELKANSSFKNLKEDKT